MQNKRLPTKAELELIEYLLNSAYTKIKTFQLQGLKVQDMNDGGMGTLRLFPVRSSEIEQEFRRMVSEYQYTDIDGVLVICSLYLDKEENLFELEIWKTDNSQLKSWPKINK